MIDKENIRQLILIALRNDYENAIRSANSAHEAATNEESKAENKYDTRGLEASYLAEGQSRRVAELEEDVAAYENLALVDFFDDAKIRLTAVVTLEDSNGARRCLFVGPHSGGLNVELKGVEYTVVTPMAPLGSALIGKQVGDEVVITAAGTVTHYEVFAIC